jgi:hypothetical protein
MRHLNRFIFSTTLLMTAMTSQAVQLGSAKGAAVFGRPLDLSVQVRLETPAEEASNCFTAEIFQADNKFDVGRVRLDLSTAANGLDATVRIRSVTPVNEPWAKVILRSNCGSKVSRQYDFLTDFADTSTGNMLAENTSTNTSNNTPTVTTASAASSAISSEPPVSNWRVKQALAKTKASPAKVDMQTVQATPALKKTKQLAQASSASASSLNTNKKTAEMVSETVGQPRLKMETFELADERQVLLKLSTALVEPTGMRTPEEIQALAQATAVWRAINGMPAEVKTPAALTTPVAGVDTVAQAKAPAAQPTPPVSMPALMNQKLAGKSEFSNLMVYGLVGLLTLTLACIAWLWLRVRQASRAGYGWLHDAEADDALVAHEPTQFMHSNFYETTVEDPSFEVSTNDTDQAPEPNFDAEPESETKHEPEIMVTTADKAQDDDIFVEVIEETQEAASAPLDFTPTDTKIAGKAETPIVSSLPPHFDDPRFEERVLRNKKKNKEIEHDQAETPPAELMDFVLTDAPPKLRAISTPTSDQADKAHFATTKPSHAKDDNKGNLINFDVFAEPEPLNKSTRFVR